MPCLLLFSVRTITGRMVIAGATGAADRRQQGRKPLDTLRVHGDRPGFGPERVTVSNRVTTAIRRGVGANLRLRWVGPLSRSRRKLRHATWNREANPLSGGELQLSEA